MTMLDPALSPEGLPIATPYSLPEASDALGVSEPVLVRLCHYFKRPFRHYQNTSPGFDWFKDEELRFSEDDIHFFGAVQQALMEGHSLESLKAQLPHNQLVKQAVHTSPSPPPSSFDFANVLTSEIQVDTGGGSESSLNDVLQDDLNEVQVLKPNDTPIAQAVSDTSHDEPSIDQHARQTSASPDHITPPLLEPLPEDADFWERWAHPTTLSHWPVSEQTKALMALILDPAQPTTAEVDT
jgi:hypothetical protein